MPPGFVHLRFHGSLLDFFPKRGEGADPRVELTRRRAPIKDLVESLGVPHPEIDLILVNQRSEPFEYVPCDGDTIEVFPVEARQERTPPSKVRPSALAEPRFIIDENVGKLTPALRMLGFDCLWDRALDDAGLAAVSARENRILLTRDIGVLKRSSVRHGYWVRSSRLGAQAKEVVERFDLVSAARPFSRCLKCNSLLRPVPKETIGHVVAPQTLRLYDEFFQCLGCARVFWKGSHYLKMVELVEALCAPEIAERPIAPAREPNIT